MKRRRAKKIRFRGHLWTRAKFAKKYGKRKAAKCFSKRHRKYSRRKRHNGAYPYFTVIKGGSKRKKYRRPKLRVIRGGRRYRPAANCRR